MGFEMGSDNLERDSSSDAGTVGAGVDTATSAPSGAPSSSHPPASGEPRSFHALKEKCSLKIEVFNKFRDKFQFHDEIRARLPRKGEKAYAFAHGELMPNSWRIVISCMVIWTIIADGDMITLNEFVHLYHLKESKEFGYYEFVPWNRKSRLVVDLSLSFLKERLELEGKFKERVQEAIKYASTIDDFDKLVEPRTLVRHCLGPEPSDYVLRAIDREEKKQMTTKFNKEMYAKIKGKKNEPLSAIGQRKLRITDKDKEKKTVERVSSTPALDLDEGQAASLGVSVEEVVHPFESNYSLPIN
uniref:Uncharacterized protein n=1 Tax=Quercus lobata TaxID=97700 RepID=A0A7N2MTF2_QUELO